MHERRNVVYELNEKLPEFVARQLLAEPSIPNHMFGVRFDDEQPELMARHGRELAIADVNKRCRVLNRSTDIASLNRMLEDKAGVQLVIPGILKPHNIPASIEYTTDSGVDETMAFHKAEAPQLKSWRNKSHAHRVEVDRTDDERGKICAILLPVMEELGPGTTTDAAMRHMKAEEDKNAPPPRTTRPSKRVN